MTGTTYLQKGYIFAPYVPLVLSGDIKDFNPTTMYERNEIRKRNLALERIKKYSLT
jgi:hypothetical protein